MADLIDKKISDPSLWEKLVTSSADHEKIGGKARSFAADVWYHFKKRPTAILGIIIVILVSIFAFIGPLISQYSFDKQFLNYTDIPPAFTAHELSDNSYVYVNAKFKPILVDAKGNLLGKIPVNSDDYITREIAISVDGEDYIINYSTSPIKIFEADGSPIEKTKFLFNKTFVMGTDHNGRDICTRAMYGTRISMFIALIATLNNLIIGVFVGGISGYVGGSVDTIIMRVVELISAIPLTLYVILIMVFLNSGLMSIVIALSTVYWVTMARVVRGEFLKLRESEFVQAAKTIGSKSPYILLNHLVPNAMGSIIVTITMQIPSAIFIEAFLSFIGLGVQDPMASLGTMCNDASSALASSPYQLFVPALLIIFIMFGFNFIGDGLRDALDPKMRR